MSKSQSTLSAAGSSGSGSGNTLTVNVALSFTSSFTGAKNNSMFAQDQGGLSTGLGGAGDLDGAAWRDELGAKRAIGDARVGQRSQPDVHL